MGARMLIAIQEGEMPTKCVSERGVELHFPSPCHRVVLEMSALIGVAGKCEVCARPPPPPPPPPR